MEDRKYERVFCDYQDDYVLKWVEDDDAFYLFHQVKTKRKDSAQHNRNELFGITKNQKKSKKNATKNKSQASICGKLYFHHVSFGNKCKSVHIVSNVQFEGELHKLIETLSTSASLEEMKGNSTLGALIAEQFALDFEDSSEEDVHRFLQKLELVPNKGDLKNPDADTVTFLSKIYDYSEIRLDAPQAQRIAKALVDMVRERSIEDLPASLSEKDLEDKASIDFYDVLGTLSISKRAYDELHDSGDPQALRNASILERMLKAWGFDEEMIADACRGKVKWDNWDREFRHQVNTRDLGFLMKEVRDLLLELTAHKKSLDDVVSELRRISKNYTGKLFRTSDEAEDLVFGLFWGTAVKEETFDR